MEHLGESRGIGSQVSPQEFESRSVAGEGGMTGRRVEVFGQQLTKAAEAISQFKPTQKFWRDNGAALAGTADPLGQDVQKQLDKLHVAGRIDFSDMRLSPANLKQYNAQISTVLKFLETHGSHLDPAQKDALKDTLLSARATLIRQCETQLQTAGISQENQKKLCALLNQLISEIPFDQNIQRDVAQWATFNEDLTALTANPALIPLLAPASKIIRRNMLAINKEMAKHIERDQEGPKVKAEVADLAGRHTKMKLEGASLTGAQRQAGAHPSRWNALKAKIAEFFGRVGRSAESQAASEVLVSDLRAAYGHECGAQPKPPKGTAKPFFNEILKPLTENKWFQGTLRNNAQLRAQFEEVKTNVLTAMIDDLEENLSVLTDNSMEGLRALQDLKREVEGLRNEGADKTRCTRLIAQINARQQECFRAVLDGITAEIATAPPMTLRRLSTELGELRNEVDADVFHDLRNNVAGAESAITERRVELERNGVDEIARGIQTAREPNDFYRIKQQLDQCAGNDDLLPATRRSAARYLKDLEARLNHVKPFVESLERATENLLRDDGTLQNPSKFLKDVDTVLTFLDAEPHSNAKTEAAERLLPVLQDVVKSTAIAAQLGTTKHEQLRTFVRRCEAIH
jgi:hypothetical protein